jgi:hypothetical protein
MFILTILIQIAALVAVALLVANQTRTQVREYRFYRARNWDFSVESGLDRMKLDEGMLGYNLGLSNWQRFYLFRPYCIFFLSVFFCGLIYVLFT